MQILLTGDHGRDEFAGAAAEIKRAGSVIEIACLRSAAEWLTSGETPTDLTIVAQGRPGQFSPAAIEALRRPAPLTPIVALLGAWCEGEMRSGSPWPGVTRVYWHQWSAQFQHDLKKIAGGEMSAWSQPITATAEERLLRAAKPHHDGLRGVAAVVSDDCELADWLATVCGERGMSPIVLRRPPASPIGGVEVVLWDAGLATPEAVDALRKGKQCFPGAVVLVLADFPRTDDIERFLSAGTAAILSKPVAVGDLTWQIDRMISRRR